MKVLRRYIAREVRGSVLFVLLAFLALFAFFDLINELKEVGRGGYQLQHAFIFIALNLPGYVYDLMPIAALIGSIYALARLASLSEFTIMRASGMSTGMAWWALVKVGIVFVVITFLFGEVVAPYFSDLGQRMKLQSRGASLSQEFRSGLWAKDVIRQGTEPVGSRFVNVREVTPDGRMIGIKLYEFDRELRMTGVLEAEHAEFASNNTWRLFNVNETRFSGDVLANTAAVASRSYASRELTSEITPEILSVVFSDPDRMSAFDLAAYTRHLAENNQATVRYEIAFWKKLVYPFAVLVMMALALPFAYIHFRSGGLSLKIFIGIMIGVAFQLLNSLFAHVGLLKSWPAFATAVLPSAFFLVIAVATLRWVQRR